jgi:shikimate dehydrogenase
VSVRGLDDLPPAAVAISTLPAGVADGLRPCAGLLDAVYEPWPTQYALAVRAAGGRAVGGFAVLLAQAGAQVGLFTGLPAPLAAMRVVLPVDPDE